MATVMSPTASQDSQAILPKAAAATRKRRAALGGSLHCRGSPRLPDDRLRPPSLRKTTRAPRRNPFVEQRQGADSRRLNTFVRTRSYRNPPERICMVPSTFSSTTRPAPKTRTHHDDDREGGGYLDRFPIHEHRLRQLVERELARPLRPHRNAKRDPPHPPLERPAPNDHDDRDSGPVPLATGHHAWDPGSGPTATRIARGEGGYRTHRLAGSEVALGR